MLVIPAVSCYNNITQSDELCEKGCKSGGLRRNGFSRDRIIQIVKNIPGCGMRKIPCCVFSDGFIHGF